MWCMGISLGTSKHDSLSLPSKLPTSMTMRKGEIRISRVRHRRKRPLRCQRVWAQWVSSSDCYLAKDDDGRYIIKTDEGFIGKIFMPVILNDTKSGTNRIFGIHCMMMARRGVLHDRIFVHRRTMQGLDVGGVFEGLAFEKKMGNIKDAGSSSWQ